MDAACQVLHATAIAIDGQAALIIGPSGAGKSDLALRLIMTPFQDAGRPLRVDLVADDQVIIRRREDRLLASAPHPITGLLEVRGLGILPFTHVGGVEVALVADVDPAHPAERFPEQRQARTLLGVDVPLVLINAREASAPAKVVLALLRLGRS